MRGSLRISIVLFPPIDADDRLYPRIPDAMHSDEGACSASIVPTMILPRADEPMRR
jgi:hypothetical protein